MSVKVHSYPFVRECTDGAILEALEGTITYIGSRRAGQGEHGEWSFQTIAISNGADKLDVKLKDRPELTGEWKGKTVRICSTINSKNNRTGLYAVTEQHEGKTYNKAKATASADIIDLATAASGTQVREAVEERLQLTSQAPASQAPANRTTQPPQSPPAANQGQKSELQRVKERVAKYATLQGVCYDAAVHVAHGIYARHGIAILPTAVGIMADKIFIEMARKTDVDILPFDAYAEKPFRGKPLSELIPAMRQQIAEGKAEMEFAASEKRMEIGRQHAAQHSPEPQPDPEDDTVPF